jgi:hypothetical protein
VREAAMTSDGAMTAGEHRALTDDPSMGPQPQAWPITVEQFLAGTYLEPADILLMRQRRSTFAFLVRRLTGSYFSKASLIFLVPHREQDFGATFVIESTFRGVDLTDLASFLTAKEKTYVVAVKRYERGWFEQEERNLVRGSMLSHIKAGYDYGRLLDNLWGALGNSAFIFLRVLLGPRWVIRQVLKRSDPSRLNKFVGPGFIQWGYQEMAKRLVDDGLLPRDVLDDVIFRDKLIEDRDRGRIAEIDVDDVLGVTAEDMAKSTKLAWKYAIIDGEVHEISTEEQFYALVKASRQKWKALLARATHPEPAAG